MPGSASASESSMFSHFTEGTVSNSTLLNIGGNLTSFNFALTMPIPDTQLGFSRQDTDHARSSTVRNSTPTAIDNRATGVYGQQTDSEEVVRTHASSEDLKTANIGSVQLSSSHEPDFSFQFTPYNKSCRAYIRRMLPLGMGYPLWEPELNQNLPLPYRRHGVKIGDIVVVTRHGGLDPLFNGWRGQPNYLTAELPADLLFPSESSSSTSLDILKPCTKISTNIHKFSVVNAQSSEVSFTYRTKTEGAIIFLPTGASQVELNRDEAGLLAFIAKNAERYYAFARNVVRCNISRDSLYLVTGFIKTSNWGIAMYDACHDPIRSETIKFGKSADGINPRYDWKGCRAGAETKSGPSMNAQLTEKPNPENQCLFLSGYKIALSENAWSELVSAAETTTSKASNIDSSTNELIGNGGKEQVAYPADALPQEAWAKLVSTVETTTTSEVPHTDLSMNKLTRDNGNKQVAHPPDALSGESLSKLVSAIETITMSEVPNTDLSTNKLTGDSGNVKIDYPDDASLLVELNIEDFPSYFLERDGRLFPSNESSPYPLPIDTPEQERMNVQHSLLHRLIGANYVGPVREILTLEPERQKLVVDLCTGTGKWVIDMAREFPHVQFRGLDIVPIATRYPPPNVRFELHDINDSLRWSDNSVDFIHARSISMAVRDYPAILREVARVLRPGGLFVSGEWGRYAAFHSVFGLDLAIAAPASFRFYEALTNALRNRRGIEPIIQFIPSFFSTSRLFTEISSQHFTMPIGP